MIDYISNFYVSYTLFVNKYLSQVWEIFFFYEIFQEYSLYLIQNQNKITYISPKNQFLRFTELNPWTV